MHAIIIKCWMTKLVKTMSLCKIYIRKSVTEMYIASPLWFWWWGKRIWKFHMKMLAIPSKFYMITRYVFYCTLYVSSWLDYFFVFICQLSSTAKAIVCLTQFRWHETNVLNNWQYCLRLEEARSFVTRSTIIHRFLCGLYAFPCARASKLQPANIYIAWVIVTVQNY